MKKFVVLGLLGLASIASAGIITDTPDQYNASTSSTGNVTITDPSGGDPYNAGTGGPGFCVLPGDGCDVGSGVTGSLSWSDLGNGDDQITVSFTGSNASEVGGTFDLVLSGFNTLNGITITNVTDTSNQANAFATGSFGLAGFTADSIDLQGSTPNFFNATNGGVSYTFDVQASSAPEPGSVLLALIGLGGVVLFGRRRMSASRS